MVTKQIIYNSESEANDAWVALENDLRPMHNSGTLYYTYVVKHPTLNKWAIRINVNDRYYHSIMSTLRNSLVNIANDWIVLNDLELVY